MRFWMSVEYQDADPRRDLGTCTRGAVFPGAKIHAALPGRPAPALHMRIREQTSLVLGDLGTNKILIAVISGRGRCGCFLHKPIPDPTKTPGIPPHHAAVDVAGRTLQIPEIAYGPEFPGIVFQDPAEIIADDHIQIKIQELARKMSGIKHLHLVPPALFRSRYARPFGQAMLDILWGYRSVMLGPHMQDHWYAEVT